MFTNLRLVVPFIVCSSLLAGGSSTTLTLDPSSKQIFLEYLSTVYSDGDPPSDHSPPEFSLIPGSQLTRVQLDQSTKMGFLQYLTSHKPVAAPGDKQTTRRSGQQTTNTGVTSATRMITRPATTRRSSSRHTQPPSSGTSARPPVPSAEEQQAMLQRYMENLRNTGQRQGGPGRSPSPPVIARTATRRVQSRTRSNVRSERRRGSLSQPADRSNPRTRQRPVNGNTNYESQSDSGHMSIQQVNFSNAPVQSYTSKPDSRLVRHQVYGTVDDTTARQVFQLGNALYEQRLQQSQLQDQMSRFQWNDPPDLPPARVPHPEDAQDCMNKGYMLPSRISVCYYFECIDNRRRGILTKELRRCAPGSRLTDTFTGSHHNPCVVYDNSCDPRREPANTNQDPPQLAPPPRRRRPQHNTHTGNNGRNRNRRS